MATRRKSNTEPETSTAVAPEALEAAQEAAGEHETPSTPTDVTSEQEVLSESTEMQEDDGAEEAPVPPASAGATPATVGPEQATGPASATPAPVVKAHSPQARIFGSVPEASFLLPDASQQFPGFPAESVAELGRVVSVQVTTPLKGCITLQYPFELKKGQQVRVPKWFALQFQSHLVIKE